jgi:hypothetical protein
MYIYIYIYIYIGKLTSGGRSVGIVRSRSKGHGVRLFVFFVFILESHGDGNRKHKVCIKEVLSMRLSF